MQINIRTFVLGANHGQLLQAFGMKCLIEKILPESKVSHDLYHNHFIKELLVQCKKGALLKIVCMTYWWFKLVRFSSPSAIRNMTIFGADTIWMKNHPIARGDKFYFGHDIRTGKLCSFAASNAGSSYQVNDPIVGDQLESFEFLGVRDFSTADFVARVSSKQPHVTCDPAFFIDTDFYSAPNCTIARNGISVYATRCKSLRSLDMTFVPLPVRSNKKWKLRFLGYSPSLLYSFSSQIAGPAEVLSQIQKSSLLITDTFHGVVMALMTNTPFLLLSSDIVYSRLNGPLLEMFDNRRIIDLNGLEFRLSASWVYSSNDLDWHQLAEYVESSGDLFRRYLLGALKNVQSDEL